MKSESAIQSTNSALVLADSASLHFGRKFAFFIMEGYTLEETANYYDQPIETIKKSIELLRTSSIKEDRELYSNSIRKSFMVKIKAKSGQNTNRPTVEKADANANIATTSADAREQTLEIAKYIIQNNCNFVEAAKHFGLTTSTINKKIYTLFSSTDREYQFLAKTAFNINQGL